jgi:hypothetical protein
MYYHKVEYNNVGDVGTCQQHNPPYMPVHCVGLFSISYTNVVPGDSFN